MITGDVLDRLTILGKPPFSHHLIGIKICPDSSCRTALAVGDSNLESLLELPQPLRSFLPRICSLAWSEDLADYLVLSCYSTFKFVASVPRATHTCVH